ncbi:hypothetical protein M1N20_01655 [Dehalococcoidia bacterium]|nr:hypothetical protein [Dehalococcoidia bacterium]
MIPQSLQATMDTLKERQKQVKAYTRYLEKVAKEIETSVNAINDEFTSFFPGYELTDHFKAHTVKKFVQLLPVMKVVDAMQLACLKMMDEAVPDEEKGGRAIEYFCGICWNWIKRPETREW